MSGKIKAVLILGIMYALGVMSGVAWQGYRSHHFFGGPPIFAEHRIKRLTSRLHLSPTQEQAVRDILQKAHERATQVNEEVSWDLADIHRDSVEAIRKVLTPDQMREFEKLHRGFHERHHHIPDDDLEASPPAPAKTAP